MLGKVDAADLVLGADPKPHEALDQHRQPVGHREGVAADHHHRQTLLAELAQSATVEKPLRPVRHHRCGEQPDQQDADNSTDKVHAHHIERVIVVEFELQADRERAHDSGRQSNDGRAECVHCAARRCDRHQAGNHSRGGTEGGRLAVPDLFHRKPSQHAQAARDQGIEEDRGC